MTEGPDDVRKLVSQRERWQRVIDETVVHYRRMWFNPRYGSVGHGRRAVLPAHRGALAGDRGPRARVARRSRSRSASSTSDVFLVVVAAMAFMNAASTAGAILLDDLQSRLYRVRDLARLLFCAPFDLVLYRPIIAWARFKGTWRFLRGDKAWHKFERNVRAPA